MNPEEQTILDLSIRISEWEEIPLQTRRDFLAHLLEQNQLDEKSLDFMQQTLDRFELQEAKKLKALQNELQNCKAILMAQKEAQTSWKARNYQAVKLQIENLVDNFKSSLAEVSLGWNKAEESHEKENEIHQIAALKAQVGA